MRRLFSNSHFCVQLFFLIYAINIDYIHLPNRHIHISNTIHYFCNNIGKWKKNYQCYCSASNQSYSLLQLNPYFSINSFLFIQFAIAFGSKCSIQITNDITVAIQLTKSQGKYTHSILRQLQYLQCQ